MSSSDGDSSRRVVVVVVVLVVVLVVVVVLVEVVLEVVVVVAVVLVRVVVAVVVVVLAEVGGWGVSPTGKSCSFRSCVRAKLCAPARDDVASHRWGFGCSKVRRTRSVPVPFPLCRNVKVIEKLF